MLPRFSIVTPSFRQLDWLDLCAASIADQKGVEVEHIVQDGGTAGIGEWAAGFAARIGARVEESSEGELLRASMPGYRLRVYSGPDGGMYDAVNKGLLRASGDVLAYLNCDEQYLEGALERVGEAFVSTPMTEVLFGDVIVTGVDGSYVCSRQVVVPRKFHILTSTLVTFTAATFFRARLVAERGILFSPEWRIIGDADWVVRLLGTGARMRKLGVFASTFADTGENLCLDPKVAEELLRFRAGAPWWVRMGRPIWTAEYRARKLFSGGYFPKPVRYAIYTTSSPAARETFICTKPVFRWASRG